MKKWVLREKEKGVFPEEERRLSKELGVSPVMARLLSLRGYRDPVSAERFLSMKTEMLCDPRELKDIDPAVTRIGRAVKEHEKIAIYGDYDVDGVTAVSTLYLYLKSQGADVLYYVPHRLTDGYGVSLPAVENLALQGVRLIITVDTGITAGAEVERAKELGVDFVVTDHHECCAELPRAVAVVNPHRPDDPYPFKDLAGVGVIFKVLTALDVYLTGDSLIDCTRRLCRAYADLVAIGTIADVMPILGENKIIVKLGLSLIEKTERPGIIALLDAVSGTGDDRPQNKRKSKISAGFIGFTLAPRINAAGRVRSATLAIDLFLSDSVEEARPLAEALCEANRERQNEENLIMQEAYAMIEAEHDFEHDRVIVLDSDKWHHGIIGIVASRITERYGLPSILISFEGAGEGPDAVGKGSGRSIKGMNLMDALVHSQEYLVKFGGHELAAGLSVTRANLPAFRRAVNAYAREVLDEDALTPTLEADMELSGEDATLALAEELRILEPCGVGNPVPVFVMREVELIDRMSVSGGKHTRLTVATGGKTFTAMYFSCPPSTLSFFTGDKIDLLFTLDVNEYNGRRSVQFIVRDARLSATALARLSDVRERYARIWAGEPYSEDDVFPTRDDFAALYVLVRKQIRAGVDEMSHRTLLARLAQNGVGYVKLKLMIRIFQELNLMGIDETSEDTYHFHLYSFETKIDLEKSNLLRRLRAQRRPTDTK